MESGAPQIRLAVSGPRRMFIQPRYNGLRPKGVSGPMRPAPSSLVYGIMPVVRWCPRAWMPRVPKPMRSKRPGMGMAGGDQTTLSNW